ncbi:hypothetical protein CYMTET_40697 [Cymbomonas tetramitiformis]|uniref:Uncharacterized protein n=1 Tax=Cymbomonas tetramitiformis TaxID=36881 RepID=A0AAE0C8N0_9CHLO|nr:hypothetical protein CYMTET_40697 [Cymbomonas tetramitiformis]
MNVVENEVHEAIKVLPALIAKEVAQDLSNTAVSKSSSLLDMNMRSCTTIEAVRRAISSSARFPSSGCTVAEASSQSPAVGTGVGGVTVLRAAEESSKIVARERRCEATPDALLVATMVMKTAEVECVRVGGTKQGGRGGQKSQRGRRRM